MNRTILLEEERNKSEGEMKRKFLMQHARQQERTQRVRTNNTAPTRYQPTMQYRSSGSNTSQTTTNYKNNNSSNNNNNQPKNSSNTTTETHFGCHQLGYRVTQCPYKATNSALAQSIASNRTATSRVGRTAPQNSGPPKRNAQSFRQGHVNHVNAEGVQAAPDVMYGEFLVNSTSATVLFDSSASHSFVSACFVLKNSLRIVLFPTPLLI
jgi:hypothetical protein